GVCTPASPRRGNPMRHLFAAAALVILTACGGGGGSSSGGGGGGGGVGATPTPTPTVTSTPTSAAEAERLLTQATFGPTTTTVAEVRAKGIGAGITAPQALPMAATSHQAWIDARAANTNISVSSSQFYESWWRQAVTEPDQLRQRTAFALSQIFVISQL